jgi:pimeloyl-ACP methyl ester carboxylesterase
LLRGLDNTRLIRQGLEASFYDQSLVTDDMVARYHELSRAPGHREILLQLTLGFRDRNYATPERLAPLSMPVLILSGDHDNLVPVEHARQFNDAIAGSELVVFENIGHIPQEETPDTSAMAVHEFMYRIVEGSALAAE